MIVKKTKQLGNFKKGINLYVPRRRSSSAPAGFPDVASTNQIAITNITGTMFGVPFNGIGTYTKNGLIDSNLPTYSPYYAFDSSFLAGVGFRDGQWYLFYWSDDPYEHAVNASSDPTTIPTTGWSPAITIIAAPEIGSDNPANAAEPDATAYVLIDGPFYNTPGNAGSGFVGGQSWRKMQPGVAVNGRASYSYGNEGVNWTGTQWQYTNTSTGVISSSLSDVAYPWLATAWTNGYSAAKVTSTYNKTTNYPAVP